MHRYVHRSGVGVIGWRQASGVAVAATLAPRENHRKVVSRGRVVRSVGGYGVVSGGATASASITTEDSTFAGSASVSAIVSAALTTAGSVLTGSAASGSTATMSVTTANALLVGSASGVTATIGRPTSDITPGTWLASTGTDLFAMVDEVTPDPLDYIYATSVGATCVMALNTTSYPGSTTSQQLKYRASSSTGNSVIVRLKEGATTIRSETQVLTASDTEYTIALLPGEIAGITSGSLSVELESA